MIFYDFIYALKWCYILHTK